MDMDQRLEKLTERHEALTRTIELWTHEWNERAIQYDRRFAQIATIMERLAHIAEVHERRLDDIQGA